MTRPVLPRPLVLLSFLAVLIYLLVSGFGSSMAAPKSSSPNKGLFVSPASQFTTIDAGSQKTGTLTVGNYTAKPITVNLSVKQFSVSSYSYTYEFSSPDNNWLVLGLNRLSLAPGQHQTIKYAINVPKNGSPGSSYYTFFASSVLSSKGIASTAQAASLLYLTVNGSLTKTSRLQSQSIQRFVFGSQVTYHFNVIDTGNVYYFIYVSGSLHGLWTKPASTPAAHIILPGKVRQFTGTIPHPFLPGIYKATYGYTTDAGARVERSQLIFYLPPWSIISVLFALLALNLWLKKK